MNFMDKFPTNFTKNRAAYSVDSAPEANPADLAGTPESESQPPHETTPAPKPRAASLASGRRAHVIVLGNQKGGSGKSTTAMHIIAGLLSSKRKVAALDLDLGQESLRHYIENRKAFAVKNNLSLPMPVLASMPAGITDKQRDNPAIVTEIEALIRFLRSSHDFLVIDTPGNETLLSRIGHSFADTLLTPINDSFVDLDVLGSVDSTSLNMNKPSRYAEMVFEVKMARAKREHSNRTFDWVVARNRTSALESNNQKAMGLVLERMSKRLGFRQTMGFSERVIFRELFLDGLTLLDIRSKSNSRMNLSHVAARNEVRNLLTGLKLPI
ncbi:MAG: division plane positioning ATPase MipZ [Alphaproteobacteria bacterium]